MTRYIPPVDSHVLTPREPHTWLPHFLLTPLGGVSLYLDADHCCRQGCGLSMWTRRLSPRRPGCRCWPGDLVSVGKGAFPSPTVSLPSKPPGLPLVVSTKSTGPTKAQAVSGYTLG